MIAVTQNEIDQLAVDAQLLAADFVEYQFQPMGKICHIGHAEHSARTLKRMDGAKQIVDGIGVIRILFDNEDDQLDFAKQLVGFVAKCIEIGIRCVQGNSPVYPSSFLTTAKS